MPPTTRRRLLALAAAAFGARLLGPLPASAETGPATDPAQDPDAAGAAGPPEGNETPPCFSTKEFGPWTGKASNELAGAGIGEVEMTTPCEFLWTSIDVSEDYEAKISIVAGDSDGPSLDKASLLNDENRLVLRGADGNVLREVKLCGVCTDLQGDEAGLVLPLDFAPHLRQEKTLQIGLKIGETGDCRFNLELEPMRQALAWAAAERDRLQADLEEGGCEQPQGCVVTTACCGALGLPDDCFELRTLRRYRDQVLSRTPDGRRAIDEYYRSAPELLAALPERNRTLFTLYWRYILPSAVAAKLQMNRLTFRIYSAMMTRLNSEYGAARR